MRILICIEEKERRFPPFWIQTIVTWISMHFQRVVSCFSCPVSTDPYINPEVTFCEKVGVVPRGIST